MDNEATLNDARLDAAEAPPAMNGTYNQSDSDEPYDFCLRGMAFFSPLQAGDNFPATATLSDWGAGSEPQYVLQVSRDGADPVADPLLFKEVLGTQPAANFSSHSTCVGNYPLGQPVNVAVQAGANAMGGIDVQVQPQG
jgi:hypothetical protein